MPPRSVAFLWGARKTTNSPMSYDLVVDHIVEGDKTNYAISNLQFLTIAENIARTFARVSTIITV